MKKSLLILILLLAACAREMPPEEILARVGDKTITTGELIARAEYTLRPPFARGSAALDKKIILNALIAEKLFALEAGDENPFITSPHVQAYLTGRREQAMRDWLYHVEAWSKAEPDTSLLKERVKLAVRSYNVDYLTLPDSAMAWQLYRRAAAGEEMARLGAELAPLARLPGREVSYGSQEPESIINAFYTRPLATGELLPPFRTEEGSWLLARISAQTLTPLITDQQLRQQWEVVKERMQRSEAQRRHTAFIRRLMQGQELRFDPPVFHQLVRLVAPLYLAEMEQRLDPAPAAEPGRGDLLRPAQSGLEAIAGLPLLQVGKNIWTVQRFVEELRIHPLVFRKKQFPKNEFAEQLQLAIIDLVSDRHLADYGYAQKYDRVPAVERTVALWRDNLSALWYRSGLLAASGLDTAVTNDPLQAIERVLQPRVRALQQQYSGRVSIDARRLENIRLTRTDMIVHQPGVPFPAVVPSFPLLTADHRIDYGRLTDQ